MRRFKSKRKSWRLKTFAFLLIMTLSFSFFLSYFAAHIPENQLLSLLIDNNFSTNKSKKSTQNRILDYLLDTTIGREYEEEKPREEYTSDPKPEENSNEPIIYIYNTHQSEEYKGGVLSKVDQIPTVMLASYYLREKLKKEGVPSIVETTNINEFLKTQGWNYNSSYEASKILLKNAKEKYPSLLCYIDIHRDSIDTSMSTLKYQGKNYARVLFVVGTDYEGYSYNEEFAQKISNKINEVIPDLSRGILKKGGKGVNGIYNQDFDYRMLLIEIGAEYNQIEEVKNTIDILSNTLKEGISHD